MEGHTGMDEFVKSLNALESVTSLVSAWSVLFACVVSGLRSMCVGRI